MDACTEKKLTFIECSRFIEATKKMNYDMEMSMSLMLEMESEFLKSDLVGNFNLSKTHYKRFKKLNLRVGMCIEVLQNAYKETYKILVDFARYVEKNHKGKSGICNCIHVIGFYRIYNVLISDV